MSIKLTWFGHAALGLEIGGYKLLVDPYFTGNAAASVNPDTLSPDFILITHGHHDHLGDTPSIARRTGALVISNNEIHRWLRERGLRTHGMQIGGGYKHPFGHLKLTHAEHASALPDESYGGNPAGLLITTSDNTKIYIAGDTGLFSDMKLIGEEGIYLAVLPIGDNFTMGPDDALRAVKWLEPKHVIPYHYNTWDLIRQDPHAWAKRVTTETSSKVHVLNPDDSIEL